MPTFDLKQLGAGLTLLGVLAGLLSGHLRVMTPAAQQCEVDLAAHQARLELYTEAADACEAALTVCAGGKP